MGEMMHFPDTVEEFMELFKVIDSDHVYSNGIEFVPIFRMQQWFDHLKAQPKTDGDKIRAMTDEELAIWIAKISDCGECNICGHVKCMTNEESCACAWHDWLKQECDDNGT